MASPPDDARPDTERDEGTNAVRARAKGAFTQLANRGEPAELVYDSLAAGQTEADRFWLVFQHPQVQIQLSVTAVDPGWDLTLRVDPAVAFRAELELEGAELALVERGADGAVTYRAIPRGVMRLVLHRDGTPGPLHTDWFLLGAHPAR